MLDENEVVEILAKHLSEQGYEIKQKLSTKQKGIDVIAQKGNECLMIEAKGETSSREGSQRYGKPYTASQVFDRVAKGVYTAIKTAEESASHEVSCLAFPDSKLFREYLSSVISPLKTVGIVVFMVSQNEVSTFE